MLGFINDIARYATEAIIQGKPTALLTLFFISALTEIGVPFPFILDTLLIFTGYKTGLISAEVGLIMLSLLLGRVVGASAIYWLTRIIGLVFIRWISKRFPYIQKRMDWLTAKLGKRAPIAVAVARLTPGLLTPSTVAAGVVCINFGHLLLGISISSVIADGVLLVVGFITGKGLEQLGLIPSVWMIIVGLVLLAGIIFIIGRFVSRCTIKQ
jgi:membrane protein DedA with SNARE-associated domain